MTRPAVAIFSTTLLPASEGFIRAQAEALSRYQAVYIGCRSVGGLDLPADRTMLVNRSGQRGRLAEAYFKYAGRSRPIEQRLAQVRPALVHAHFGLSGALAMPLAQRLGLPLVVTYHGSDATTRDEVWRKGSHTQRIYLRRRPELFRRVTLFLAVSKFIRARLIEQGVPPDRVRVHYIGVDTDTFCPPPPDAAREPTVLFVGRLAEVKGCRHLVHAMKRVQEKHPAARLRVIGDGPLRAALESEARASLRQCEFLGLQPHEVVRREMGRARVFCVPSITTPEGNAEGFGLVFAEAQAMGTPVVSSDSGGIGEAVADGETGFLAPEGDAGALAHRICRLLEDEPLWRRFSVAARKRVCEHFDLKKQTRLLEDLYASTVAHAAN